MADPRDPPAAPEGAAPATRRRLLQAAAIGLTAALLGWLLWRDAAALAALELRAPLWLLLDPLLILANLWGLSKANQVLLRALEVELPDGESLALVTLSRLGNLLGPLKAGAAARGAYLVRRHRISLPDLLALLAALQVIYLALAAATALAVTPLVLRLDARSWPLLLAELGLLLGALVFFAWQPRVPASSRPLVGRLRLLVEGWRRIQARRRLLALAAAWSGAQLLTGALMFCVEFRAFGHPLGLPEALYIHAALSLEGLLGLTPAGLGVREALVVLSAEAVGAPEGLPLAVALLRRAVVLGTLGLLAPWATRRLRLLR